MPKRKLKAELLSAAAGVPDDCDLGELYDRHARGILGFLANHWLDNGPEVLEWCAKNAPEAYLRILVSTLPKNVKIDMNVNNSFDNLSLKQMTEAYEVMKMENEQALALMNGGLKPGETAELDRYASSGNNESSAAKSGRDNKALPGAPAKH